MSTLSTLLNEIIEIVFTWRHIICGPAKIQNGVLKRVKSTIWIIHAKIANKYRPCRYLSIKISKKSMMTATFFPKDCWKHSGMVRFNVFHGSELIHIPCADAQVTQFLHLIMYESKITSWLTSLEWNSQHLAETAEWHASTKRNIEKEKDILFSWSC